MTKKVSQKKVIEKIINHMVQINRLVGNLNDQNWQEFNRLPKYLQLPGLKELRYYYSEVIE